MQNILLLVPDLAAKLILRANSLALPAILAGLVRSIRRAATGTDAEVAICNYRAFLLGI